MANLLIASRNFQQAQEQTDLLLQKQPNDPQTHFAVSSLLTAEGNLPAAIEEMQKAIALGASQWTSYLSLAFLQLKNNQPDAAEANFNKAVEVGSDATGAQLALGLYYQARGRFSEAEQQFRHAIGTDPKSPEARASIEPPLLVSRQENRGGGSCSAGQARLAKQLRWLPHAGRLLRTVSATLTKPPPNTPPSTRSIPKIIQVKKNYIQLLIQQNRLDEARKLDDEILKAQPSDSEALDYRAEMQLRDGHAGGCGADLADHHQERPQ